MTDETDDPIRHDPTCRAASINYFTGRRGDPMAQCRTCKRFTVLRTVADEAPAELRLAGSRYWCPAHQQPVTWRGVGCTGCESERAEARARRTRRRAARAQADIETLQFI